MTIERLAYLGPEGSYSELAAETFRPQIPRVGFNSIREAFTSVALKQTQAALVPIENAIQGSVVETLDQLLFYRGKITIQESFLLGIEHCLGARPGTVLSEIKTVISHEQALRQCGDFLQKQIPHASQRTFSSTGAAAIEVGRSPEPGLGAIASESTLQRQGLNILARGIADIPNNQTRFVLVALEGKEKPYALPKAAMTSIGIDPGKDRQGILFELLQIISVQHKVNLLSIHSRPDSRGGFVFHFDLEGDEDNPNVQACVKALEAYCREATGATAALYRFGSYSRNSFYAPTLRTIGIVGGQGRMGTWLKEFLEEAGLQVLISDISGGIPLEELADKSDAIILSVPMRSMSDIARSLAPVLKPGTLVVENCSIKSCALPHLLSLLPEHSEVLGIHTMFGPDVTDLRGENIIITKSQRSGERANALENLFYKYGAHVFSASIEEHDTRTAFLQSLLQLNAIVLAEVLRTSFGSLDELTPFSTPNSRLAIASMNRVLKQVPELTEDLQNLNERYPAMRARFLTTFARLSTSLERGNTAELLESIRLSEEFFADCSEVLSNRHKA